MHSDLRFPFPFPYPPTFLFVVWPLRFLSLYPAYFVWLAITLAIFVGTLFKTCSRLPFNVGCAAVAPACAVNLQIGQTGFLTGALLTAGLRLAAIRPIASGMLLGLLSVKPTLGLLVPLALAAARLWRAFFAASLSVAALAIIATALFGPDIWSAWLNPLRAYETRFALTGPAGLIKITVLDTLLTLGAAPPIAIAAQSFASASVAGLTWASFRRGSTRLAHAALLTGTFLFTPHALIYDTPMVVAAMALFIQERVETGERFKLAEILILAWAFFYPMFVVLKPLSPFYIGVAPLIGLYALFISADLRMKYGRAQRSAGLTGGLAPAEAVAALAITTDGSSNEQDEGRGNFNTVELSARENHKEPVASPLGLV